MNRTVPDNGINVLLMLKENIPARYRDLHTELRKLRRREQDIREELSRLERHAAIEGITLTGEADTKEAAPEGAAG